MTRRIAPLHAPGGLESAAGALVKAWSDAGFETLTLTAPPTTDKELPGVVEFVPWGPTVWPTTMQLGLLYRLWLVRAAAKASRCLREGDTLYLHGAAAQLARALRQRLRDLGVPTVVNPHGLEQFRAYGLRSTVATHWQRRATASGARFANSVIATDGALAGEVGRVLRIPLTKIVVIPNAVDVGALRALADAAAADSLDPMTTPGEGFLIVSVGRVELNKGYDVLAAALGLVAADLPQHWHWLHIGDGSQKAQVLALAEAVGVRSRLSLRSSCPDGLVQLAMRRASVFVQPSRWEGSSLTTLEAMAQQTAVIGAATGGIPDKVIDGVTGLLFEPGDATSLSQALLRCARSTGLRERLAAAGYARVSESFDIKVSAAEHLDLFAELRERMTTTRRGR